MIRNPFEGEYHSLSKIQLWKKYQDYRNGKKELPETIGEWTRNLKEDSRP